MNLTKHKGLRPAVFLDRDGTLIEDRGHLSGPGEVRFFSATIGALERLRDDFLFFLVTNQPGVAEGLLTLEQVARVNAHVVSVLARAVDARAAQDRPAARSRDGRTAHRRDPHPEPRAGPGPAGGGRRPRRCTERQSFGMLSPTTAEHVRDQLGDRVDVILDGGPCAVGVESAIVSFCGTRPTLLRPGGIAAEDLEAVLGPLACPAPHEPVPLAPGRLPRHYAPRTPLVLGSEVPFLPDGRPVGLLCLTRPPEADLFAAVEALSETGDLTQAAANLFAALRRLDALGLDRIVAMPVPEKGLGATIMDRLRKASSPWLARQLHRRSESLLAEEAR